MAKLEGKVVLIAGGTGGVGEGIVRAFIEEGATLVVPSRSADKLEQLRSYLEGLSIDRFIPIVGDMSETESAQALRDEVMAKVGRLDAVVASLNGKWNEDLPLTKVPLAEWRQLLDSNLTSHFVAAQTFLPVLTRGSSYTLIGGGLAEEAMPNYGPICVPAAGQLMLTRMLVEENKGSGVRINEVVMHSLIATRKQPGDGHPEWITADEVGAYTAWLASDEASMVSGSIIHLYQHT